MQAVHGTAEELKDLPQNTENSTDCTWDRAVNAWVTLSSGEAHGSGDQWSVYHICKQEHPCISDAPINDACHWLRAPMTNGPHLERGRPFAPTDNSIAVQRGGMEGKFLVGGEGRMKEIKAREGFCFCFLFFGTQMFE